MMAIGENNFLLEWKKMAIFSVAGKQPSNNRCHYESARSAFVTEKKSTSLRICSVYAQILIIDRVEEGRDE